MTETITNTLSAATVYTQTLESGSVAAVGATATFGDLAIVALLGYIAFILTIQEVKIWRLSLRISSLLRSLRT